MASVTRLFILLFCLAWAPAATAGQSDRDDPPTLIKSTDCAQAFRRYDTAYDPRHFAISGDGRACAFTYCISGCTRTATPYRAIQACQSISNGSPCGLYAYRGKVVSDTLEIPASGSEQ